MAKSKKANLRWHVAALLFFASVINYVDRQTLSVLAPTITSELGLSDIDYANVLQAFLICYTGMYIVSAAIWSSGFPYRCPAGDDGSGRSQCGRRIGSWP